MCIRDRARSKYFTKKASANIKRYDAANSSRAFFCGILKLNYDMSILDIVTEQAQAYFAGQKSADEVAKLVQSKANIYVNEQR